jgi:GNAT superfamily N-acetyltransferase
MKYRIEKFKKKHIKNAIELFIGSYKNEKVNSPLLPNRALEDLKWIAGLLNKSLDKSGVALFDKDKMLGYMTTSAKFTFKGQNAANILEYGHASIIEDKKHIYHMMYMKLAEEWILEGINLHIICHFAGDVILKEMLFNLGFGAILKEQLRKLNPVECNSNIKIVVEKDYTKLVDIQVEHMKYYPRSPILILKNSDKNSCLNILQKHSKRDDKFLVYYEENKPAAYFIIGESAVEAEGFLLAKTNTAQVESAFSLPFTRGKGIGQALMNKSIEWAKENGYDRLFVEHETSNYFGGRFWNKYFNPYLYVSMRYIDVNIVS